MVSRATIQTRVDKGYGVAANILGEACQWYRPTSATAAIVPANLLGTAQVLFDTSPSMSQKTPRQRDKPESWFAGFDRGIGIAIGDFLVTPEGDTYFVTTMDAFRPSKTVLCNRMVNVTATTGTQAIGYSGGYGGGDRALETPVLTGWPAAVIKGPRSETGDAKLPGDVKLPWEELLLPVLPSGVVIRNDMIATYADATGETFRQILSMVELTSLGYRCTAVAETA